MNDEGFFISRPGSQRVGMGGELFTKYSAMTQQANHILGYDIAELCLYDPDKKLGQTKFTQPALYVVDALNYHAQIEKEKSEPSCLAGHSLGEYVALYAAGVYDFDTGLRLVNERASLMSEVGGGGMAAITQITVDALLEILRVGEGLDNLDVANYNSPTQTVVSGDLEQLKKLSTMLREHGAQYYPLRVSAAFHSRYMRDAESRFSHFAQTIHFRAPNRPVIANLTGQPYPSDSDAIRGTLTQQISNPVRWVDTIQYMLDAGISAFEELGPGNVLSKLVEGIRQSPKQQPLSQQRVSHKRVTEWSPEKTLAAWASENQKQPSPKEQCILLCPGIGGQYFLMGRKLYENSGVFRQAFDRCSTLSEPLLGESLSLLVYSPLDPNATLSRTLHSHLANFAFGYSMIEHLRHQGIDPPVWWAGV
ncbi:[acyl-carrier-protein] S-malonyltransferase [Veronia nyctiphanis]|uniref:[acyl-carrier-protein] S-malonyltransferase n=1 Tax=Veronia nyctiphanis TaxID=1278244 RepID=A0A4Q0YLW6_9GAMM|nr:ACP S-malonyltransferase [Veronia nyctiphanis]RXJ71686.1 [acyl-carrier-protein] S-malonyltransferase [Veronia nyctiphanis]